MGLFIIIIIIIIVIIIIIIIIIIIVISFIQGIYTYIPETNHVPREYRVAAILSLLFMVSIFIVPALALLYFYLSAFRSMCAVLLTRLFIYTLFILVLFIWHFFKITKTLELIFLVIRG